MTGGGALIDGNIHKIRVFRMLAGDPETVSAVAYPKLFPEMDGEEGASLWATFRGGTIGSLTCTWNAPGEGVSQTFLATGTAGTIQLDFYGR